MRVPGRRFGGSNLVDWTWVLFFFFGVVRGRRLGGPGFVGGVRVQGSLVGVLDCVRFWLRVQGRRLGGGSGYVVGFVLGAG